MSSHPDGLSASEVLYSVSPIDLSVPYDETSAKGKTILITGGASGIGEGIFRKFAALGACVIIGDLNTQRGEALVSELRSSAKNPNLHFLPLDVTSYASQTAFFRASLSLSPSHTLNTIIVNAGVGELGNFVSPTGPAHLDPPEPDLTSIDVNLKGAIYTTRLALHHLQATPAGKDRTIIFLGSIASFAGGSAMALYCASKHGLLGFFRSLRLYPSMREGVRLNIVCPYFVDTPILPIAGKVLLTGLEMARLEDVVDSVGRFVCDDGVAGRCLMVAPRGSGGIVEVGLEEMEEVEVFTRRVVRALNVEARVGMWARMVRDLVVLLVLGPLMRLVGR